MDAWQYEPPPDLAQPLMERLRRVPREPDMLVYGLRSASALACRGWLRAYHRFRVAGRERLPTDGSFVLVANHSSHLDALCLLATLPLGRLHRAFPAAARDYFFVSAPRAFAAAVFVNALPFERETSPRQSLAVCRQLLDGKDGCILILFPEGGRSQTGQLGEFKPGIGIVLAGCPAPVLPCHIAGAHAALPKDAWLPRPRAVSVTIGEPLRFADRPPGKESAVQIARELRSAVLALAPNELPGEVRDT
jgi:1-acyl-sn-glycerol-3-phosphate acyltransferase